jgi:hypothetical protein
VGVWYDGMTGKWAIFNQDRAVMPVGAAFNVYAIQAFSSGGNQSAAVLLIASTANINGNWVYIIFNAGSMDPIPAGASFNLLLDTPIVHGTILQTATAANTAGNHTTIDNALTNNNANAIVFATSNFNPPGAGGTYDNHNIGVFYDNGKWSIFNADGAAMPVGAAFDVLTV